MAIHDFAPISNLTVSSTQSGIIGVDLNDSTQPVQFSVTTSSGRNIKVSFKTPVGEMVRAVSMPEILFNTEKGKLKGMNEHTADVKILPGQVFSLKLNIQTLTKFLLYFNYYYLFQD